MSGGRNTDGKMKRETSAVHGSIRSAYSINVTAQKVILSRYRRDISALSWSFYLRNFSRKLFIMRMVRGSSFTESLFKCPDYIDYNSQNLSVASATRLCLLYYMHTAKRCTHTTGYRNDYRAALINYSVLVSPLWRNEMFNCYGNQCQTNILSQRMTTRGLCARKVKQYKCHWSVPLTVNCLFNIV